MAGELSADELHALLGAYALDAVAPEEREQVERYLARSSRARTEVAGFRETAALLAHAGSDAPPGLWDRISHTLEAEPPPLHLARPIAAPRPRWTTRVVAAVGIAAATIAVVVLSVQVLHQGDQIEQLEAGAPPGVLAAAEAAASDSDARRVSLESAYGARGADVVYLPDGSGYLLDDNLARLPDDRTYQLWALVGTGGGSPRAISAGVLGPDPGVSAFRFDGDVVGFLVTEEDSPGVSSSSNPPVLRGDVA